MNSQPVSLNYLDEPKIAGELYKFSQFGQSNPVINTNINMKYHHFNFMHVELKLMISLL